MMERKYRCERTNGRFIVGELEKAIHTGIPVGELTGYLQKVLLSGRRSSYLGDIMEILERAQRTVRKIPLGGYTETEINRAVTKKKQYGLKRKYIRMTRVRAVPERNTRIAVEEGERRGDKE